MIIVEAVNNALTSYIRLCNYVKLNSNEPIKVAHLQKLANQSVLNSALVIEKWYSSFSSESKKKTLLLFDKYFNILYISTRFRKYLSYLEVQKSSKVDITKKEVFSEFVIKTLYGSKFLVSKTFSN